MSKKTMVALLVAFPLLAVLGVRAAPDRAALDRPHAGAESVHTVAEAVGHVPIVVLGRCTGVRSDWNAGKTLITTTATYEIERAIKGRVASSSIEVKQLGGTVGRITQMLVDGPSFAIGERSVLLLGAGLKGT